MSEQDTISPTNMRTLTGIPASSGIAVAKASVLVGLLRKSDHERKLRDDEVSAEIEKFTRAVHRADEVIVRAESLAQDDLMSQSAIFEALRMMLHDTTLTEGIVQNITKGRMPAHAAIASHLEQLAEVFSSLTDDTMRSRAEDIRALEAHLLSALDDAQHHDNYDHHSVLVLQALSPLDVVEYARNNVPGIIVETGGINSHAAILARSFSLPMVSGVDEACTRIQHGETVVLDGYTGSVYTKPDEETLEQYHRRKEEIDRQRLQMKDLRDLPAETLDGVRVTLAANIDVLEEIDVALENGARKIGLLRTELSAPYRLDKFTVEEQTELYRRIAERAFPMTVTMRAFDVGRDKPFAVGDLPSDRSSDSPLGLCGVRFLLKHEEILRRQIEATYRASGMKNLRLMIPMISSVEEMRAVKAIAARVREELRSRGVSFDEHLGIGAMIETPSSALRAGAIAQESDFLSIGTNDLTQYTLAIDRVEPTLAQYYDELHPSVLRLIRAAALAGERAGVPITICGELAANPLATTVLLGIGVTRFSVSPAHLPSLKQRIRAIDTEHARNVARRALNLGSAAEVRALIGEVLSA